MTEPSKDIVGRWIHVHEEDDATHRVFRRHGSSLPPSRGRVELDIAPDLSVRRSGPGADDRPGTPTRYHISFGTGAVAEDGAGCLRIADFTGDRLRILKD